MSTFFLFLIRVRFLPVRRVILEADLTVGGKVGLGEMALHNRDNHH
jgi:hypothetical protein